MSMATSVRIVQALRESILDGVLPPGLQVRQEALAEQFGVSRVPVREALRQLEAEGLIQTELHKGAFVSSLSLHEVAEMLDIRVGLELRALKLALPNFTRENAREAERILKRYDGSESPREWRDFNLAFHLAIYKPCNRPRLVKMIEDVALGTHRFLRTYVSAVVGREQPQAEHRKLLDLCVAGNAPAALKLLENHIERTKAVIRQQIK
jgi:DNA-binding GntR family transcriptional regulator